MLVETLNPAQYNQSNHKISSSYRHVIAVQLCSPKLPELQSDITSFNYSFAHSIMAAYWQYNHKAIQYEHENKASAALIVELVFSACLVYCCAYANVGLQLDICMVNC